MTSLSPPRMALPTLLPGTLRRVHAALGALPAPSVLELSTRVPTHVQVGATARVLSAVRRPGVNLAIWLRGDSSTFAGARRALFDDAARHPVELDETIAADVPGVALAPRAFSDAARWAIGRDIDRLRAHLLRLQHAHAVRVKLTRCDGDECRVFHVDRVGYRLITTYVGPGTDWLEDGAARREHLGGQGLPKRSGVDAVNNAIVADWTRVRRLPRFAVAAFRGARAGAETLPIVHRSPPIAGTGLVRLRLVLETAGDDCGCVA